MPAYNACGATLVDVTSGDDEVVGMQSIEWGETLEIGEYGDNTTACSRNALPGPVTREGSVTVNLQSETRGKLPFRAGQERSWRLYVDETGDNYWELEVLLTGLEDHVYDLNSSDPVQATYPFRIQGLPIGHGNMEEES